MRRHFALFDSLRGISVLAVAAFHVASITGMTSSGFHGRVATAIGPLAVTLFFAISGFLLYRPFVTARARGAQVDLRRFARRRVLRVVPAYWVALTVLIVFPGVVLTDGAWRYYLFAQLYDEATIGAGIPVAWTLGVEVTFYALLPLWALLTRRLSLRADAIALAALIALGALVQILAARQVLDRLWADALPGQIAWLGLGMLLAVASVARPDRVERRPGLCWLAAGAGVIGLAALAPDGVFGILVALTEKQPLLESLARVVLTGAVTALLMQPAIFGEDAGGLPRRLLAWRPVAFFGVISYSFYLYHLTVAQLLGLDADPAHFEAAGLGLRDHVNTPVLFALVVAVTGVLATLSYRWIERPALRR